MLRPRRRRNSNEPRPQWQQRRQYDDHLGNPVVLEEYITPNVDPEPSEQVAIQVYSTVPLDEDHTALRDYLLSSWSFEGPKPLFEIYSYCPSDAFACVEHNRREIAFRKHQHSMLSTSNPPPLIPYFFHWRYESPVGCCVLINSHSYRLGYITDEEAYRAAGPAPDWLAFNRTFTHTLATVDTAQRVSAAQPSSFGPRELYPEAFEMDFMRIRRQETIGQHTVLNVFGNRKGFGSDKRFLHYGLDTYEGEPAESAPPSEEHIQQQLDQQLADSNLTLDETFRVSHRDSSTVVVSNTPDDAAPNLQYLLYVPFLSHLGADDQAAALLEKTARLFTAAVVYNLSPLETLHLEFRIPPSPSWSAILPAYDDTLRDHDALRHEEGENSPIGARHTIPPSEHPARVSPQRRSDRLVTAQAMLKDPYRVFAVVLDKPAFVREPGVCFYMTDYDDSNEPDPEDPSSPDTQVWRSAGMAQVARRLAMLAVEEGRNGVETREFLDE
ncbi:hypothetical protein BDW42DRAFT_164074 [Aspergillus taichungensis]|uniref:Uncharacterized protein n=1 Tax=Aspergillus taichungensis TaxID=482145 RepID=A0A2J5I1V1_9EURO|nr:hypothetical protein BDW42DRAFT_164074 [Aspergillus taichungensis]